VGDGVFYSNEDLHENFYSDLTNRLGGIAVTTYEQVANSVGVFAQATTKSPISSRSPRRARGS